MKRVPLKELCQIKHGGTPSKGNAAYWNGSIPWVSPKDMKSSLLEDATDHISEEAVANSATSLVPTDTILVVARSGILAHSLPVARAARPLTFNQDIKALIPNRDKVDPEYLYWFVRASETAVLTRGVKKGATVHSLQSGFLENLMVQLPSHDAQRRIVELLSRAEGIVRLRREAQQRTQAVIPALFLDMFGDPAVNREGWPVLPLSDIAQVISGVAKGRRLNPNDTIERPYLRVANVKDGYLDLDEIKTISIRADELPRLRVEPGDLLMTEGGDPDKLGRAALWKGEVADCVHQNHIFKVRSDQRRVVPTYLRALVGSPHGKAYFLRIAKRTTGIASINKTQLSAFPVLVPPLELQRAFDRHVDAAEAIAAAQSSASAKAEVTFGAILARAFSDDLAALASAEVAAVA